jgi:hypothetical protein
MTTRRMFGKSVLGASALLMAGFNTACWFTGSLFKQIMSYVGVGLTAFQAVVDLLDPAVAVPVDLAIKLVKAGFADLQLVVQEYNNAPDADKQTLLQKISLVLAELQGNIQMFWSDLNLPSGNIATLISALLSIILSTLAGFASQLPAPAKGFKTQHPITRTLPYQPVKRSKKQFEHDFNKTLTDAGKPAVKFD